MVSFLQIMTMARGEDITACAEHDYYCLLDLTSKGPRAKPADIKRQYRALALKYHPDKQTSRNSAADSSSSSSSTTTAIDTTPLFVRITRAYEVLSDPEAKAQYDRDRSTGSIHSTQYRPPGQQRSADYDSNHRQQEAEAAEAFFRQFFGQDLHDHSRFFEQATRNAQFSRQPGGTGGRATYYFRGPDGNLYFSSTDSPFGSNYHTSHPFGHSSFSYSYSSSGGGSWWDWLEILSIFALPILQSMIFAWAALNLLRYLCAGHNRHHHHNNNNNDDERNRRVNRNRPTPVQEPHRERSSEQLAGNVKIPVKPLETTPENTLNPLKSEDLQLKNIIILVAITRRSEKWLLNVREKFKSAVDPLLFRVYRRAHMVPEVETSVSESCEIIAFNRKKHHQDNGEILTSLRSTSFNDEDLGESPAEAVLEQWICRLLEGNHYIHWRPVDP